MSSATSQVIDRTAYREELAQRVAAAFAKLADHKDDIEELWAEFEALCDGETIKGCKTKTEFCDKVLGRSIRAIQYLISGRPSQAKPRDRHEQSSRPEPAVVEPATEPDKTTPVVESGDEPLSDAEIQLQLRTKIRQAEEQIRQWEKALPENDREVIDLMPGTLVRYDGMLFELDDGVTGDAIEHIFSEWSEDESDDPDYGKSSLTVYFKEVFQNVEPAKVKKPASATKPNKVDVELLKTVKRGDTLTIAHGHPENVDNPVRRVTVTRVTQKKYGPVICVTGDGSIRNRKFENGICGGWLITAIEPAPATPEVELATEPVAIEPAQTTTCPLGRDRAVFLATGSKQAILLSADDSISEITLPLRGCCSMQSRFPRGTTLAMLRHKAEEKAEAWRKHSMKA
jgi:hypothetical protein